MKESDEQALGSRPKPRSRQGWQPGNHEKEKKRVVSGNAGKENAATTGNRLGAGNETVVRENYRLLSWGILERVGFPTAVEK